MKVLVIPYNYPTTENPHRAIFIAEQVQALRTEGHTVDVLGAIPKTISDILRSRSLFFGALGSEKRVVSIPAFKWTKRLNQLIAMFIGKFLVKTYLKENDFNLPDVVHVHNASSAAVAIWFQRTYHVPFVITEHSSLLWNTDSIEQSVFSKTKKAYQMSAANIAVSEKFSEHLSREFSTKFEYVPNVVDLGFFSSESVGRAESQCSSPIIKFISIGNLTENKNHQLIIRNIKQLRSEGINAILKIAGDGPEKSNLRRLINELKLDNEVELLGYQNRLEIRELLFDSDYFLLPSKKETFGVVLIEALAMGLPVIAIKNGGSESIIKPELGILVNSDVNFKEGINQLLSTSFSTSIIKKHVAENYSQQAVARRLIAIYKGNRD